MFFVTPKLFFGAVTPSGAQNICTNENLDDKNRKLQLGTGMIGTPLRVEKLITCLQQLDFADDRAKIPEGNMLVLAAHGSSLPVCKGSRGLGIRSLKGYKKCITVWSLS